MDERTLRKLARNPHYKPNAKQRAEIKALEDRTPGGIEYGRIDEHDRIFERHDVKLPRRARGNKTVRDSVPVQSSQPEE